MLSPLVLSAFVAALPLSHPSSVAVGDLFIVRTSAEGRQPSALEFMGQQYPPIQPPGWSAPFFLLAVDLDADPGDYPVRALFPGGEERQGAIAVEGRAFPVERLSLPQEMVTPPREVLDRIARERQAAAAVYGSSAPEAFWSPPFSRPVDGAPSGNFGRRRVLNGVSRSPHSGEDYAAPRGEPVRAAAAGTVRMARELYYSGKTVLIDHGAGLVSQYFHLDDMLVEEGQNVGRGKVIGRAGDTGRVTGPHLHFGLRLFGKRVNPSLLWQLFTTESGEASLPLPPSASR